MKSNEAILILIKSLLHTENTRVDYFYNTAKEMGLKPINLYLDLSKSYDELVEFVNSIHDYYVWTEDKQGKKTYFKNVLNLLTFTNREIPGQIDSENVGNYLPALHKFGKLIQAEAIQKIENTKSKNHNQKTTYKWPGNAKKELPELHSLMISNKYKLIASDITLERFTAIFSEQPFDSVKPIKWLKSNRLLAYFLDTKFSSQDWQSIAGQGKLFLNKKGKQLTANDLAAAKSNIEKFTKPIGFEMIDNILKEIKNIQNIKTS